MNDKKPTIEGIEAVNNILTTDLIIFVCHLIVSCFKKFFSLILEQI